MNDSAALADSLLDGSLAGGLAHFLWNYHGSPSGGIGDRMTSLAVRKSLGIMA